MERPSETCRMLFQNKINLRNIVHLVGFTTEICPRCYPNRPVLILHNRYSLVVWKSNIGHSVQEYRYLTLVVAINLVTGPTRSTRAVPENKPGHLQRVCGGSVGISESPRCAGKSTAIFVYQDARTTTSARNVARMPEYTGLVTQKCRFSTVSRHIHRLVRSYAVIV